nr:hypothetical protein [Tanacetum cinerariifolium]
SLFPNKDMKEEFPDWFGSQIRQRHINNDKDPEVSTTSELFALPCGPTWTPISINSCVVDGVRYVVHSRDECRTTQNNGICSPGTDGEMYYGKGKRKPNLGSRAAGRLHTRVKTWNLALKDITNKNGPVPIRFEVRDKQTLKPLGDHAANWSRYIGEVIRGVPLYYPSWLKVPKERKATLIADIRTQFDLKPHIESPDWTVIEAGIQQHLQKAYNTNKAAFKAQHWVIDTKIESYNVEKIRRARPESITKSEWDNLPAALPPKLGFRLPLPAKSKILTSVNEATPTTGGYMVWEGRSSPPPSPP